MAVTSPANASSTPMPTTSAPERSFGPPESCPLKENPSTLHDRSVDGRAEILRIGRQHLHDLLDLQDPQHVAPAFNRVRTALALGYPEQVKITFDRGFANVHIAFGGIAKLVKVDDLRGIPMEPLIDKYVMKYVKEEP